VRTECLAEALDNQIEWGVWGGMTERERRALLRRRPNVSSWRGLLEAAMADHVAEIVSGMAQACEAANCALLGGETAEMPGVYAPDAFDIAGTLVGVVEQRHDMCST
jgi:hypothetical protein